MTRGFGLRIKQAVLDRAAKLAREGNPGRPYSLAQFGRDVGQLERGKDYPSGTVGEWVAERNEPTISTFRAMAQVLGVDAAWLMALDLPAMYYGEEPPAPLKVAEKKPAAKKAAGGRRSK